MPDDGLGDLRTHNHPVHGMTITNTDFWQKNLKGTPRSWQTLTLPKPAQSLQ